MGEGTESNDPDTYALRFHNNKVLSFGSSTIVTTWSGTVADFDMFEYVGIFGINGGGVAFKNVKFNTYLSIKSSGEIGTTSNWSVEGSEFNLISINNDVADEE